MVFNTGATEKKRALVIKFFITMGQCCQQLQNYNALMAIVAGLNGSAVHRLRKSWDLVPPKKIAAFEELQAAMSQQNNYATLRNLLHTADPPCIPYLGMYLTDLTFIEVTIVFVFCFLFFVGCWLLVAAVLLL